MSRSAISGFVLSANSELQALTTEGIGSGTKLDHIMSFNSSDDGAEFFGGRVNMKHFISVGAEDDNLDTDTGVKANFQYVIVAQRPNVGDSIIEADSDNAVDGDTPRQNTRVANFTFIQRFANSAGNNASILLRGGTDYTLVNGVLASSPLNSVPAHQPGADRIGDRRCRDRRSSVRRSSARCRCSAPRPKYIGSNGVTAAQVAAIFGTGTNNNSDAYVPTLTSLFINGATETAVPAFDATTLGSVLRHARPMSAPSRMPPTPGTAAGPATARRPISAPATPDCARSLPTYLIAVFTAWRAAGFGARHAVLTRFKNCHLGTADVEAVATCEPAAHFIVAGRAGPGARANRTRNTAGWTISHYAPALPPPRRCRSLSRCRGRSRYLDPRRGNENRRHRRRDRNIAKSVPQVVSVLSSADIARTGEGDIAGALQPRHRPAAWSATALSMSAVSAIAIRWRCSTARPCPARSRCAASCRSICSRPA